MAVLDAKCRVAHFVGKCKTFPGIIAATLVSAYHDALTIAHRSEEFEEGVKAETPPGCPRGWAASTSGRTPKFDLAMNTEVAEHVELSFHSQLVRTLTSHADLIWFSYAPPSYESYFQKGGSATGALT